jgi:membrane-associated phospholipid phosphatase
VQKRSLALSGLVFVLGLAAPLHAQTPCERSAPWSRLDRSAVHFIEPLPLALTAGSAVSLVALSPTGADHELRLVSQRDLGGSYAPENVSLYAPFVLGGGLLVGFGVSAALGACEAQKAQAAMLQAMGIGLAVTGLLKWSLGREWPNAGGDPYAAERLSHSENSWTYRPFGPRFGAWPSGHTLSMFAVASAFRTAAPNLGWPRFLGYPLALGVAAGMWLGDRHWASDVLAGALLGEAIGSSVGRSFAETGPTGLGGGSLVVTPIAGGTLVAWVGRLR